MPKLFLIAFFIIITSEALLVAQQDSTLIPDQNFEKALISQGIDTSGLDGMVVTADIEDIIILNIANANIDSLVGIQDFVNIEELNCSSNNLESLDISNNTSLKNLNVSSNQMLELSITVNLDLEELNCSSNRLDSLYLSDNLSLTNVDCSNNQLVSLDIGNNVALTNLYCSSNHLDTIDVEPCGSLKLLDCSNNWLKQLDVSYNIKLEALICGNNQLADIDVMSNDTLTFLICSDNMLKELNLTRNKYLKNLTCSFNQLKGLTLEPGLVYDNLEVLSCSYNQINILDVSRMPELTNLDCASNQIKDLDLSNNTLLTSLDCSRNLFKNISLSNNTLLSSVNVSSNLISNLDLSQDTSLTTLDCSDNLLTGVNISNGENDSIVMFNALYNPFLRCIVVDDTVAANSYKGWLKDNIAFYELVCNATTNIPDPHFEQFLIDAGYDNSDPAGLRDGYVLTESIDTITLLDISSVADTLVIGDLKGIEDFQALEILLCGNNQIDYLDLNRNLNLVELDCSRNYSLYYLDVSLCSSLDNLNCSDCDLENLIVGNNLVIYLDSLDARLNSRLTCIKVDDLPAARSDSVALRWQCDLGAYYSSTCSTPSTYIPDDSFEQYLIDKRYDLGPLDNYVSSGSINTITELDISGMNISDLTGIEDFLALERLDCSSNKLVSIDIGNLDFIKELDCTSNYLSELDSALNNTLITLKCGDNKLDSLNISSDNVSLDTLVCDGNSLAELIIPVNVSLVYLVCNSNNILELNIEEKVELEYLHCSRNSISSLDIKGFENLRDFACTENLLSTLDLDFTTLPTALEKVDCSENYLSELIVSSISNLSKLDCSSNIIGSLLIDTNTSDVLDTLICDNNQLVNLDGVLIDSLKALNISSNKLDNLEVSNKKLLVELKCDDNLLTSLETTGMDSLTFLACNNNSLTDLQLTDNINLTILRCSNNQLESLMIYNDSPIIEISAKNNMLEEIDVSNYLTLAILEVDNNYLEELNLDNNSLLINLSCSGNSIYSLNLSQSGLLKSLNVASNKLIALNIANGNNENISNLLALNNPILECIQVDDISYASNNSDWAKDSVAVYTLNCHFNETYIPDIEFELYLINAGIDQTDISGNPDNYVSTDTISAIVELDISNLTINDLTGIQDFTALEILDCSSNQINTLDLSSNTALTNLNISNNLFDSLNLSNNTLIDTLDISGNALGEVQLNALTALKSLNLDSNNLIDLDLTENILLTYLSCKDIGLQSLDLRNGNNPSLIELDITGNPDLSCIEVDDVTYASQAAGWIKDPGASYSLECHYYETYVPDDKFEQTLIDRGYDYSGGLVPDDYIPTENISSVTYLNIVGKDIGDLTGIEAFDSLRTLNCSNNLLTYIDVSNNVMLEELDCSINRLTDIDIASNTLLSTLDVSDNLLQDSIDLRLNYNLTELNCASNSLTDLYIGGNPNLVSVSYKSNDLWRVAANNGSNHSLLFFDISDNPNLGCVIVDDPVAAIAYPNWYKDPWSIYKTECTDNDNDGILNSADSCKYTPYGDFVDLFGCSIFMLPHDNFIIKSTDETCRNENNGIINISAAETYNYSAVLTGTNGSNAYYFTNGIEIRNVWSGTYELCLSVENISSFKRCFEVVINEPEDLSVLTSVNSSEKTVLLQLEGSDSYNININGLLITTSEAKIELNLDKGENTIEVRANNECQGIYRETIFLTDDIVFYPNPFNDHFYINTGTRGPEDFSLKIYSYQGKLMLSKNYKIHNSPIKIDAANYPPGVYFVTINSEMGLSKFEIVKK